MRSVRVIACAILIRSAALCDSQIIQFEPVHLRSGEQREWRSFAAKAKGQTLAVGFESAPNDRECSLLLRQRDVNSKAWLVRLNGQALGPLLDDERDMLRILPVPSGLMRLGKNVLEVANKAGGPSDDIELRDLRIEPMPVSELLRQASVDIRVTSESGPMPVRITIIDGQGTLVPFAQLRTGST